MAQADKRRVFCLASAVKQPLESASLTPELPNSTNTNYHFWFLPPLRRSVKMTWPGTSVGRFLDNSARGAIGKLSRRFAQQSQAASLGSPFDLGIHSHIVASQGMTAIEPDWFLTVMNPRRSQDGLCWGQEVILPVLLCSRP